MKHDRLSILRAQEAARLDQQKLDALYVALNGRSTRFRDDPDYAAAVMSFEVSQPEASEPALAKPVAKRSFQVGDRVRVVEASRGGRLKIGDLCTITAVAVGGSHVSVNGWASKYFSSRFELAKPVAKCSFQVGDLVRVVDEDLSWGLKNGDLHTITAVSPKGRYVSVNTEKPPRWYPERFELVEAAGSTAPAAPVAEPRYWVCIKPIGGSAVGTVIDAFQADNPHRDYWLPCDKDGWIVHEPKTNSTCPVPIELQQRSAVKFRDGSAYLNAWGWCWVESGCDSATIIAWKPLKS